MKITSTEHVVYINCFGCQNENKKTICVHNMYWACSFMYSVHFSIFQFAKLKMTDFQMKWWWLNIFRTFFFLLKKPTCYFLSINVFSSSSIWTRRISNICYCFLQAGAIETIETNIRNSTRQNRCAAKDTST